MIDDPRYIQRGHALVTKHGRVVHRPKVLPQDRYLVSAPDGIHYQVYVKACWLWRLLHGKQWRCISGERAWLREYDAWCWVESQCVNRMRADDWHGVGYARWMQQQTTDSDRDIAFASCYTGEPSWVYDLYHDGPPDWNSSREK